MLRPATTLCSLLLALPAAAQGYVETFEGGTNAGGWTFGNTIEGIDPAGGNPGAWLHNSVIDTFAPQLRTTAPGNPFQGDWRTMGITRVGVDLITIAVNFPFQRECTLMLSDGNLTVYRLGTEFVPQPGTGWKSFEFDVPSASTTLPAGWTFNGTGVTPDQAWNQVITNVAEVRFFYGDPTFFYIFDQWNVGADNARIGGPVGTPFCAGDGSAAACPCGNTGGGGEGCANSTGAGATLAALGSSSAAGDWLRFDGAGLVPNQPALLFAGLNAVGGGAGSAFGDGLRCAGGGVVRLGVRTPDASGTATWGPGLGAQGGWQAGDTRRFQLWYRDPAGGPCGSGFNTSSGLEVAFTP